MITAQLADAGRVPGAEPGTAHTAELVLYEDDRMETGVMGGHPGEFDAAHGRYVSSLSWRGDATIVAADGEVHEVGPGVALTVPSGRHGRWHVRGRCLQDRTSSAPGQRCPHPPERRALTRRPAGAAGPLVFLAVTVLAGLLKRRLRRARAGCISDLAVGAHGWLQTANFFALGAAMIASARAPASEAGTLAVTHRAERRRPAGGRRGPAGTPPRLGLFPTDPPAPRRRGPAPSTTRSRSSSSWP